MLKTVWILCFGDSHFTHIPHAYSDGNWELPRDIGKDMDIDYDNPLGTLTVTIKKQSESACITYMIYLESVYFVCYTVKQPS